MYFEDSPPPQTRFASPSQQLSPVSDQPSYEHLISLEPKAESAAVETRLDVSVVVTARNQGSYLRECLHSILAQTSKPIEIIYFDDGSADDSLRIARSFVPFGVEVHGSQHRGVVSARNQAASLTKGDYLLFVDGDNMLAPDFLERMREVIDSDHGFAYPCKQNFGFCTNSWTPPEYDRTQLWNENYVDSCTLVRRDVFEAAEGWRETPPNTMWDWDLFLRLGRYTNGVRSKATLYYRHHEQNWSRKVDLLHKPRWGELKGDIRQSVANVVVCCAYSGRVEGALDQWLTALGESLRCFRHEQRELFVIDDSPQGFWSHPDVTPQRLSKMFRSIRVERVHRDVLAESRRKDRTATARWLTYIYNRFLTETSAEVLWFIEDDIIVPPNAGNDLSRLLLDGEVPQAAVTGYYRSRHEDVFVVSHLTGGKVIHEKVLPSTPRAYDLAGTGCLMVFRPRCEIQFGSMWNVPERDLIVHAHDWVYSWRLKEAGTPVIGHPDVVCRHMTSDTESV